MQSKEHWEHVYATRASDSVSWFQEHAERSLRLIISAGVPPSAAIIDVGGGASTLVDDLLARGYSNLTVLDISAAALSAAKHRLGERGDTVQWLEKDIVDANLPVLAYDVWHDRAVFHFLTSPEDRRAYIQEVTHAVKPGGHVIVATFAEDGPARCSGLPVQQYGVNGLQAEFGKSFELLRHEREVHRTPSGTAQPFIYCHFRKAAPGTEITMAA